MRFFSSGDRWSYAPCACNRSRLRFSYVMPAQYTVDERSEKRRNAMQMLYPGMYLGASLARKANVDTMPPTARVGESMVMTSCEEARGG